MANEFFTILTATGRNKLAAATATGTALTLTQMAVGDGDNGAYYSPTEAQTALKHEVWRGAINHLAVDANNPNWIVAELVIPDNVGGFYIREVGLFDSTGAMIAVGKFPESYKPTLAAGSNKQLYVRMILEVANTSAVTLLVDPSVVLATRQYCDDKVADELNKRDGKQSVRVATTAAIALAGLQTIDGVVLVAGNRVLVKDQAAAAENGIYVAAVGAWARATAFLNAAVLQSSIGAPSNVNTCRPAPRACCRIRQTSRERGTPCARPPFICSPGTQARRAFRSIRSHVNASIERIRSPVRTAISAASCRCAGSSARRRANSSRVRNRGSADGGRCMGTAGRLSSHRHSRCALRRIARSSAMYRSTVASARPSSASSL